MTTAAEIRALFEQRRVLVAKPVPQSIPGFGDLFVRVLNAADAAKNAKLMEQAQNEGKHLVFAAGLAICDADGNSVFDMAKPEDVALLEGVDPKLLSDVFRKSQLENGEGVAGVEAAGNA